MNKNIMLKIMQGAAFSAIMFVMGEQDSHARETIQCPDYRAIVLSQYYTGTTTGTNPTTLTNLKTYAIEALNGEMSLEDDGLSYSCSYILTSGHSIFLKGKYRGKGQCQWSNPQCPREVNRTFNKCNLVCGS